MGFPKIKNEYKLIALCASLVLALSSCVSAPQDGKSRPSPWQKDLAGEDLPVQGKEAAAYRRILSLYSKGSQDEAGKEIRAFLKKYPKSKVASRVYNIRGLINLGGRRPLQAILYFKKALATEPDDFLAQYLHFNLAAAQYEANRFDDAYSNIRQINGDDLDFDTRMKYHFLAAGLYAKKKKYPDTVAHLLEGARYAPESKREMFSKQLEKYLSKITEVSDLEKIFWENEKSPIADQVLIELGRQSLKSGSPNRAEGYLQDFISRYSSSPHYAEAMEMLRTIQNQTVVDARSVGVLLPVSGKFAKFGERSLHGIELAFRIYNSKEPDSRVTLVIENSGETPEEAIEALNRLYYNHHVVAVLGPLRSKAVDEVTQRADELGVPLISLAQLPGKKSDFVFHSAITPQDQAQEMARYAIQEKGLRRFAILAPEGKFGQEYVDTFWNAVEALGGKIVGAETYPENETDFRRPIDKLTGLFYTDARQRELEELKKLRNEMDIQKRNRRTEKYFKLEPIIDFDAVFIPEGPKALGQILPTFAYRDVDKMQFLGISTWNSDALISRAKNYSEGALFVGSFFEQSQSPEVLRFNRRFHETFGYDPSLIEALSFDAASILERILLVSDSEGRKSIRDRLANVKNFPGVTGKITYREGQFARQMKVLTVQNRKIIEATP